MMGYVCYADRFADDLQGVAEKIPYLKELGITYLHLMPLLKPRPGANDGGYAVMDYRAVDDKLGNMDDLSDLADQLRAEGMSLCIDLVCNHTAKEHAWAQKAMAGDPHYQAYYHMFPDRTSCLTNTNKRCAKSSLSLSLAVSPIMRPSTNGCGRHLTSSNGISTTPIQLCLVRCWTSCSF